MIYFVLDKVENIVKIGWSDDFSARLASLRKTSGSDLEVVRLIKGEPWVERWFHAAFSEYALGGEWFSYLPEMLKVDAPPRNPKRLADGILHRRSIAFARPQLAYLRKESARRGITSSALLRNIIDQYRESKNA